jgi:hypothetical protein
MMQEDILKELELWPVWRLKVALPEVVAPDVTIPSVEVIDLLPEMIENSPLFKAYEGEDMRCLMLHAARDFTLEEEKLWANMCKAMGIKIALKQDNVRVQECLNAQAPNVVILFGEEAAQTVLQSDKAFEELRGTQHFYQHSLTINVPVIVTYDLKHLLQQLPDKAKAWEDLRTALKLMNF